MRGLFILHGLRDRAVPSAVLKGSSLSLEDTRPTLLHVMPVQLKLTFQLLFILRTSVSETPFDVIFAIHSLVFLLVFHSLVFLLVFLLVIHSLVFLLVFLLVSSLVSL